jgi:hypothetical protein
MDTWLDPLAAGRPSTRRTGHEGTVEASRRDASIAPDDSYDRPDARRRAFERDAGLVLTGLGSARPAPSDDVATALERISVASGQRPAITVHQAVPDDPSAHVRHEQGFRSLAGWVAKGAHLLRDELMLGPGDTLALAGPASWPLAAVALSAWWVGVTLVPVDEPSAGVTTPVVQHVAMGPATSSGPVLWFGDAMDGTDGNAGPPGVGTGGDEWWAEAVVPFPDRPPTPARDGGLAALRAAGCTSSQRDLLAGLADERGVLGIVRDPTALGASAIELLAALALRPLVTGSATVVAIGIPGDVEDDRTPLARLARDERVAGWFRPAGS